MHFYLAADFAIDPKAREKHLTPESIQLLAEVRTMLAGLTDVSAAVVEPLVHEMAVAKGLKLGAIAQPLRVALTGGTASPGIFEVIEIMGKELVLQRLNRVIGG